jgi:hypothetical protein
MQSTENEILTEENINAERVYSLTMIRALRVCYCSYFIE